MQNDGLQQQHQNRTELRQGASSAEGIPHDFNWQQYLNYNPDLVTSGVTSEDMAKMHYQNSGRQEGRRYKLHVTLRYTACGGLINQHYCHIAAISLAAALNASLALPPALTRNSFASYFSSHPKHNEVRWAPAPAASMWDLNHTTAYWRERGMTITEAPLLAPLPDLVRPRAAFPTWLPPNYNWSQVARLEKVYVSHQPLSALVATATRLLTAQAARLPDRSAPLLLDLPCPLFMLDTTSAPALVQEAAGSLPFAPTLHRLADKVVAAIQGPHQAPFNGLHLRMERDARDWARNVGGKHVLLGMYLEACRQAGFTPQVPLYLASGLTSYKAGRKEQGPILRQLRGVCHSVHTKEQYLTKEDLWGLTKEHQALVDFLVLARSQSFVGIGLSTFSYFLPQYRQLVLGTRLESSVLVSGGPKGKASEELFVAAARVVGL